MSTSSTSIGRSSLVYLFGAFATAGCTPGSSLEANDSHVGEGSTSTEGTDAAGSGSEGGDAENRVEGEFPAPFAEGLAPTPPMGWNSWNNFGCNTSAEQIKSVADAMVASGMADVGYQYINIDDCWNEAVREENGGPNPTTAFPAGIEDVANHVHGLGLKLGIYSDRGAETCARRHGSRGFVDVDVQAYAAWGVDYLKYDNCDYINPDTFEHNLDETLMRDEYTLMSEALRSVDRGIVFSVCAWRFYEWAAPLGQLWRTTGDITDTWASIVANIGTNSGLGQAAYAGPNQWNDPDMLEVGRTGMTDTEYRAHFSMWAIMAAPLIAGNDVRSMTDATKAILTNAEVIAVDQDALGLQGVEIQQDGESGSERSVWVKPLNEHGARAVAFLNLGPEATEIAVDVTKLALQDTEVIVRDLWAHEDLASVRGTVAAQVPSHGVVMLKVVGEEPPIPRGEMDVSDLTWVYSANRLGPVELDSAVGGGGASDGMPITIGGTVFDKGLGVAAPSLIVYRLGANCSRFTAEVGVDGQAATGGSVEFEVWGDNTRLHDGAVLAGSTMAERIDVDVTGVYRLKLKVTNGLNGNARDFSSWGHPRLVCAD